MIDADAALLPQCRRRYTLERLRERGTCDTLIIHEHSDADFRVRWKRPEPGTFEPQTSRPIALGFPAEHATSAEQIRVVSAVGMRQVLVALVPEFERATGQEVNLTFDSGATIVRRMETGGTADVVFLPRDAADRLAGARRLMPDSITDVASSRVGVAIRAGAPRPDISSPAAVRETLLAAHSIARPDPAQGGSSGLHIAKTLERLGIAEAIAAKSILSSHPDREPRRLRARRGAAHRRGFAEQRRRLTVVNTRIAFVTHLHSDHTAGYADLILTPWSVGRRQPLDVYGPKGLKRMTDHIVEAYREDIEIGRKDKHVLGVPDQADGYKVRAHEITPGAVYGDSNVTVKRFS